MKNLNFVLFLMLLCVSASIAGVADAGEAADGLLVKGEYDGSDFTMELNDILIISGGGADRISARDNSYIEVQYTSVSSDPLNPVNNSKGVWDIVLYDNSSLLWLGGAVDEITLNYDSIAILKGGYIDAITIQHRPQDSCYVEIWCQDGWSWVYNGTDIVGITGLWLDDTSFDIDFNDSGPFVTADYVYVVPEPATLVLLGIGSLLIRRKK